MCIIVSEPLADGLEIGGRARADTEQKRLIHLREQVFGHVGSAPERSPKSNLVVPALVYNSTNILPYPLLVVARLIKFISDQSDAPNFNRQASNMIDRDSPEYGEKGGAGIGNPFSEGGVDMAGTPRNLDLGIMIEYRTG